MHPFALHLHLAFIETEVGVGVADVVVAVIAVLLGLGFQAIADLLKKVLPTFNVPLVGDIFAPLKELAGGLEQRGTELLQLSSAAFTFLIRDLPYIAKVMWGVMVEQAVHVWDEVEHISETVIPDQGKRLEGQIGNSVARERVRAEGAEKFDASRGEDAQKHLEALKTAIGPVPAHGFETEIGNSVARGVAEAAEAAEALINEGVGQLVAQMSGVWTSVGPLERSVAAEMGKEITAKAHAEAAVVQEHVTALKTQLYERTKALGERLDAATGEIAGLEGEISGVQGAIAKLQAGGVTTGSELTTLQAAEAKLQGGLGKLQLQTAPMERELARLNGELGKLKATEALKLSPPPGSGVPSSITIPVAVGALGVAVSKLIAHETECGVERCGSGPGNIENVLKKLLGLTGDLAIFGMLAEAIKDPVGFADTLSPLFAQVNAGAEDAWRGILEVV